MVTKVEKSYEDELWLNPKALSDLRMTVPQRLFCKMKKRSTIISLSESKTASKWRKKNPAPM